MTAAEKKLWFRYLRQFPYKVYRQKPISNYIVDFYIPKLKLIIELDGETHINDKNIKYDKNRTKELEEVGLKVIRFWNYDVLDGFEAVCAIIANCLNKTGKSPQPPLLKGEIRDWFLRLTHLSLIRYFFLAETSGKLPWPGRLMICP